MLCCKCKALPQSFVRIKKTIGCHCDLCRIYDLRPFMIASQKMPSSKAQFWMGICPNTDQIILSPYPHSQSIFWIPRSITRSSYIFHKMHCLLSSFPELLAADWFEAQHNFLGNSVCINSYLGDNMVSFVPSVNILS